MHLRLGCRAWKQGGVSRRWMRFGAAALCSGAPSSVHSTPSASVQRAATWHQSGGAGRAVAVGALLAAVLKLALRSRPEETEFEAGRNAALRLVRSQRVTTSASTTDLARAREAYLQEAKTDELAAEISELWSSALAADILLVGPLRREVAADIVIDTRAQLRPILPAQPDVQPGQREADVQPEQTFRQGLAAWEPLLYRPAYEPRPLAQNLCLEPAIAATLDQCGSTL